MLKRKESFPTLKRKYPGPTAGAIGEPVLAHPLFFNNLEDYPKISPPATLVVLVPNLFCFRSIMCISLFGQFQQTDQNILSLSLSLSTDGFHGRELRMWLKKTIIKLNGELYKLRSTN